jgi:hypothetical protein
MAAPRSLVSVLVPIATLLGCTAGTNRPATGTAGTGVITGGAGDTGTPGTGGTTGFGGGVIITGEGATSGAAGTGAGGSRSCGLQSFDLERKPAEVLLVLDRSASMKDPPDGATATTPKWDLILPAVKKVIMDTDTSLSWGYKVFPEIDNTEHKACVAGNTTDNVRVEMGAMNATNVINAINMTTDEGDGTPTADAINTAVNYLKKLTTTNPKYILLATDGQPSCADTTVDTDGARTLAKSAVMNAAAAGFHTFVVGVATTKASDKEVLNDLADAGLEPRNDPRPLADHFYLGTTQAELGTALQVITGSVASCIFKLNQPPPVPDNPAKLGVYITGAMTKIPYDGTMMNGWAYTDSTSTTVQVFGNWCDQIKGAGANKVQIIFGCIDIDVP